jgi:copper transporter 1
VLGSLCDDMPGMRGCTNYTALCGLPRSAVAQCTTQPPIPRLPRSADARGAVLAACADHPMQHCYLCTRVACADPLGALAAVCLEHPSMAECAAYHLWCAATQPDMRAYCEPSADALPPMTMWFHQRVEEVVLCLGWVTRTPGVPVCVCACAQWRGSPSARSDPWLAV